jgi:hypothetical protein
MEMMFELLEFQFAELVTSFPFCCAVKLTVVAAGCVVRLMLVPSTEVTVTVCD